MSLALYAALQSDGGGLLRSLNSVDHIIPLSLGGTDDEANKRASHLICNVRRGAGTE